MSLARPALFWATRTATPARHLTAHRTPRIRPATALDPGRAAYSTSTSTSRPPPPTRPCPKCSTPIPLPSSPCPSCQTLIPIPSGLSHHAILDLSTPVPGSAASAAEAAAAQKLDIPAELATLPARGFALDARDVRARMLRRQKDLHPDKYAHADAGADGGVGGLAGLARDLSGRVNKAYETLSDPLKRAEYILAVHSPDLAIGESDSLTDPALLMEVLEAREELEGASTSAEVDALRETNHRKVEATIASIAEALSADPPDLGAAKILTVQLKYWQGLETAAKEWSGP